MILTGRSKRTIDSLADRLESRVSKADLLAIIRELDDRPREVRTTSRTTPTGRRDYEIGPPHGHDPISYENRRAEILRASVARLIGTQY